MLTTNAIYDLYGYAEAFQQYAQIERDEFKMKSQGGHALIIYQEELYQVSHIRDIVQTCRNIFDAADDAICMAFPKELWRYFLKHRVKLSTEDLIIDLYLARQHHWELEEFNLFAANLLNEPSGQLLPLFKYDEDVEDMPILARAIKDQYKNEAAFFQDCVDLMTLYYPEKFGNGQRFEVINTDPDHYTEENTYYIYTVGEDY